MYASDLVGRLAIRGRASLNGYDWFTSEPVLIMYADDSTIICCPVVDSTEFSQGVTETLNYHFCDNNWKDFGAVLSLASKKKAGVVSDLFDLLGITADRTAINNFVKVVTFKQALEYLVTELGLENFMKAVDVQGGTQQEIPEISLESDFASDFDDVDTPPPEPVKSAPMLRRRLNF